MTPPEKGLNVKRIRGEWHVMLNDVDTQVMGARWVPLPLTARATTQQVDAFVRTIPIYRNGGYTYVRFAD